MSGGSTGLGIPAIDHSGSDSEIAPRAYLNYIFINRQYDAASLDVGYVRIPESAYEDGSDRAHALMTLTKQVKEPGFVYVYLSNDSLDNSHAVDVFFDDFKVEHVKSPVIESSDYYPFGLTYNNYTRENSLKNRFKFQNQEHVDDLGLNWDSFKWRNHMPDIGRFFNLDPLSEKYYYNSPYAFSENKVVAHRELEGLESDPVNGPGDVMGTIGEIVTPIVNLVTAFITGDKELGTSAMTEVQTMVPGVTTATTMMGSLDRPMTTEETTTVLLDELNFGLMVGGLGFESKGQAPTAVEPRKSFNGPTKPVESAQWGGPTDYSHIPSPKNLANTKPTPRQVREMKAANRANNSGLLRDDVTGEIGVDSKKSVSGVTPPSNEIQVDHKKAVNNGGTRETSNLQLMLRKNNRAKSDN